MTAQHPDAAPNVSRETRDRLEIYANLLRKWSPRINLVAPRTLDEIWTRHFEDSLQLLPHLPSEPGILADLGSGGGLPGLVLAAALAETGWTVRLIESDHRKAVFLRTCAREMGLSVEVIAERIETCPPSNARVVTARALAPLDRLLPMVHRHLAPGGRAVLLKGRTAEAEIAAVENDWTFDLTTAPSITDPDARILVLEHLARA